MRRILHLFIFTFLFLFGAVVGANAQTYTILPSEATGSQTVNGVTVTIAYTGPNANGTICSPTDQVAAIYNSNPTSSTITYSFSQPLSSVLVPFYFEGDPSVDTVNVLINGSQYTLTSSQLTNANNYPSYSCLLTTTAPAINTGKLTASDNSVKGVLTIGNIAGGISSIEFEFVGTNNGGGFFPTMYIPNVSINSTNPTTCGGSDGTITVQGLLASTSYNVNYDFNGTPQTYGPATSDASGNITISGLIAGVYNNFIATETASPFASDTAVGADTLNGPVPAQPGTITGSATVCGGQTGVAYSVTNDPTATSYTWTYSGTGATINGTTNSITVDYAAGATAGTLSVTANNACGSSTAQTLGITINAPPSITTQPTNQTQCAGGNVTFTGAGAGAGLTYQWEESTNGGTTWNTITNGGVYSGATTASLTLTGVTAGMDNYQYRLVVSGTCTPPATSNAATLTVNTAPSVTTQPTNQSACIGGNATFTATATGAALTYQWEESTDGGTTWNPITNGGIYSGATTASLTLTGITAGMAGYQYHVIVSGTCTPPATSNAATLSINAGPAITTQPVDANACPGSTVNFNTAATGAGLTYQWEESTNGGSTWTPITNGGIYGGATSATLTLTGITAGMNGYEYHVIVSGTCTPPVTSNAATLSVYTSITINTQPADQGLCPGGNTTMSVNVTGSGVTYQWQQSTDGGVTFNNLSNTPTLSGVTTNTITFTNVTSVLNGYQYRVIVSSPCAASVTSSVATLTIYQPPAITSQPVNDSLCPGGNASFSATATGTGITYQWQESTNGGTSWANVTNGGVYSGATTATLTLTGVTAGMNGYEYQVVVTGTCTPVVTSSAATLTVFPVPVFTSIQPATSGCEGSTVTLTDNVTGTGLTYQWQESTNGGTTWANVTNGGVYSGATTTSLTLTGLTNGMNGYEYQLVATNATGCTTTSGTTTLTVNPLPVINTNPSSTAVCVGNNTSFSVSATGTGLTYQWQVSTDGGATFNNVTNGGVYSGATTATLAITAATIGMDGYIYNVIVTSGSGCTVTSGNATLTVGTPPAINTQPTDTSVCESGNASFTVSATGYNVTYQWYVSIDNGLTFTSIPPGGVYSGTTSPSLHITGATNGMNGYQYRVDVIGTCTPPVTSNAATLTVNPLPVVTSGPANTTTCPGSNATFTVAATGTGLTYQWQESTDNGVTFNNVTNGGVYSGATTASLTITGATSTMNGYQYQLIITSGSGCITTVGAAILTIDAAPAINTQPANASACPGNNATFTVAATGSGTLSYQWQESTNGGTTWNNITNGGVYSGATTTSLTLTGVTVGMDTYQYRVIVSHTSSSCTTTSNAATLTINPVPTISTQPANATACAGTNTSFSVTATGTGLTYQWQENSGSGFTNITNGGIYSGATSATLNLTGVTNTMNGYTYQVIVTNGTGCNVTSGTATLTVNPIPAAPTAGLNPPTTDTFCSGSTVNLTATTVPGGGTYTWSGPSSFSSNQQNPSISNVQTAQGGTYSVYYTSTAGCNSSSSSVSVVVNQSPGIPTLTANMSSYCVGTTVTLNASATNAPSGSTWTYIGPHWPSNLTSTSTTQTITNVQLSDSGFYYVYVTSTNGCQSASASAGTHVVVKPLPPNPTVADTAATVCAGQTYCLNASSSSLAVGYSWTGPAAFAPQPNTQQNPCINNITTAYSGVYTVYTTLNGCQSAQPATIDVHVTPLPATPTATSNTPCLGDTLQLIAHSATSGAGYSWTGPATFGTQTSAMDTLNVPNVPWSDTGNYNVYATTTVSGVTCFSPSYASVHVSINPLPATPTLSSNSPVCMNQTLTITATDTPATGVSYSWSSTSPTFNPPASPGNIYQVNAAQLSDSGNYVVYSVVNGCKSATPASIQIAVNPLPETPVAGSNSPICENGVLHLTSSSTTGGVSYSWTGPNGFTSNSQNPNIASTPLADAGTYSVYAILNGCASDTAGTTDVVVNPIPPDPTASSNSPVCSGPNNSIMLFANPGAGSPGNTTYQWYGPSFPAPNPAPSAVSQQQNPVINNPSVANAGIDSVYAVLTYAGGQTCYSTNPGVTSVVVNPTPAPPTTSNITLCQNSPAGPLSAIGTNLTWYTVPVGGVGSAVAPTPVDSLPGLFTYYVTQSTSASCTSDRAPLVVTVDQQSPEPSVPSSTIHYCQYDQATILTATGQNLLWYTASTGGTGSSVAPTPSTATPGTTVYYVTQNSNGCESKRLPIAVVVNQKPQPPAVHDVSYCQGEISVPLTAVGQDVLWYTVPTGGVGTPVGPTPSTLSPDTLTYYVTQTINGCESDRVPQHVYIFYKPNAVILDSSSWVCQHQTDTFGYYGNALPNASFAWGLPPGATIISGSGSSGIVVRFDSAGMQTVTLTVSNGTCESALATITVDVRPLPDAVVTSKHEVCEGDVVQVGLASVTPGVQNYTWDFDGGTIISQTSQGGPYNIKWTTPGIHVVSVVPYLNGCGASPSAKDTVNVHALPDAHFTGLPSSDICTGDTLQLSAALPVEGYNYQWTPTQFFDEGNGRPTVLAVIDFTTYVKLHVVTEYGCEASDSEMVNTMPCCNMYFPTAFTPNGDGKNDYFRPITRGNNVLKIFRVVNRWGETVFETTDEHGKWDGTYNGVPQDIDTYYWFVDYMCSSTGKEIQQKGEVYLIR